MGAHKDLALIGDMRSVQAFGPLDHRLRFGIFNLKGGLWAGYDTELMDVSDRACLVFSGKRIREFERAEHASAFLDKLEAGTLPEGDPVIWLPFLPQHLQKDNA